MKKQVFFSVFLVILSWPFAEAQAQFARKAVQVSESLKHPVVAGAVCVSLQNQQRRIEEKQKQATLNASHITQLRIATHQVHSAVFTPSKVTAFNPTKHPVTVPVMPSLKLDTIPDHTPLYHAETQEKSRVEVLKAIEHVANGDTDADAYKEWLTRGAATGDPYCQSALKILKENMIEGHDR